MVHYDGYYLEEPLEIINKRASNSVSYLFTAYVFDKNGSVKVSTKHEKLSKIKDFSKGDFEEGFEEGLAMIEKNKIHSRPIGQQIGGVILTIISSSELVNKNSGNHLYFVPWEESLKNQNNSPYPIINELFGPFTLGKFKEQIV